MQEASFHTREVLTTIFGTISGLMGLWGIYQIHDGFELHVLAIYQIFQAVLQAVLLIGDWVYAMECCQYSRNAMEVGVFWSIHGWPVESTIKGELKSMKSWPMALVHRVANVEVWALYLLVVVGWIIFYLYVAKVIWDFLRSYQWGPCGLGANYSLQHWHQTLLHKADLRKMLRSTREMAAATWQDVDWRADELAEGIPDGYNAWGPRPGYHPVWQSYGTAARQPGNNRSRPVPEGVVL